MTVSAEERHRRERAAEESRHSLAMEGLSVDAQTREDQDAYARGDISAKELTERGRAHVRALVTEHASGSDGS